MTTTERQSKPRRKPVRDLSKAITLRPAEVFQLYGIPSSTLCEHAKHPDPALRLPSRLIPGRKGSRGMRLIDHAELKTWLAKFGSAA